MSFSHLLLFLVTTLLAKARPESRIVTNATLSTEIVTSVISATYVVDFTSTLTATFYVSGQQSASVPQSTPTTYQTYVVSAVSPGSPIDMLPIQATGLGFFLGGYPATYCPSFVEELGGWCPAGNITGIDGCSLVSHTK